MSKNNLKSHYFNSQSSNLILFAANCMASSFQFLHHHLFLPFQNHQNHTPLNPSFHSHFTHKCTSHTAPQPDSFSDADADADFPIPPSQTTISTDKFPIEKRRKSEIIRDRAARRALVKPEPENFEIGWKRTKPIPLEKPIGYVIMDFLEKLVEVMDRDFGSAALLMKVGEIVAERAIEEAEVLRDEGKVDDRMVTELSRVLKLMEMDLAMLKAAVKEETLKERLDKAKARCRQAILVANSF